MGAHSLSTNGQARDQHGYLHPYAMGGAAIHTGTVHNNASLNFADFDVSALGLCPVNKAAFAGADQTVYVIGRGPARKY